MLPQIFILLGKVILKNLILPTAIKAIDNYLQDTTDERYDDKLLEITKKNVSYFANKDNNTVTKNMSIIISDTQLVK